MLNIVGKIIINFKDYLMHLLLKRFVGKTCLFLYNRSLTYVVLNKNGINIFTLFYNPKTFNSIFKIKI